MRYVDSREEATHFKTLNGTKWVIENLENRQNYSDVSYEEIE